MPTANPWKSFLINDNRLRHQPGSLFGGLGSGEIAAIALAIEVNADAVLIDDRAAIREARKANLTVLTTFAVREIAAIKNLIDF